MGFSNFHVGILLRVTGLVGILAAFTWIASQTTWYVTMGIFAAAAVAQVASLVQFASRSGREVARFLDSVAFDDSTVSFSALAENRTFGDLGVAMTRVLDQLRTGRAQREEQSQYLQELVAHIPVALLSVGENGTVQLLNRAARQLFSGACVDISEFSRYGQAFATGLESVPPGDSMIVRMERPSGALQLKAAVTGVSLGGVRHRLISLQNIETELTAQELASWQTVIRVMAHEIMNSLTPISSLAATAEDLVGDVLEHLPLDDPQRAKLVDAREALETMARRSQGLLHFVQNHRRLTKRMVAQVEIVPIRRVFARLQRLLADELSTRNIELVHTVTPETLEITVDAELLDQALINLMRNAMEALRDDPSGCIVLTAALEPGGHTAISVADNGQGIAEDHKEKIFVPFFTTKRQGSGIGLTLVRQIATVHGATVSISETPGGGATVSMKF